MYRFCAPEGSEIGDVVLGVVVEGTCGSDDELASLCNGFGLTIDASGLSKRVDDGLDKGVLTVVAELIGDKVDVLHELGTTLSARSVRLANVRVVFWAEGLEASSKDFCISISSSHRTTNGIRSGLDKTRSRCPALAQQLDRMYS